MLLYVLGNCLSSYHFLSGLQQGALRICRPSNLHKGLLELYMNGKWNKICTNDWSFNEANVACRQMGFAGALAIDGFYRSGGLSSEENLQVYINCTGSEPNITSCNFRQEEVHNCNNSGFVGVSCSGLPLGEAS